jgi:hypothetical protein
MLGTKDSPSLLIELEQEMSPAHFDFWVVNGAWQGVFTNGYITVLDCPSGDFSSLEKTEILCDNPHRRSEFWLETCLPDSELDRNPAAKKAWDQFQVIAGLSNVTIDKTYQ